MPARTRTSLVDAAWRPLSAGLPQWHKGQEVGLRFGPLTEIRERLYAGRQTTRPRVFFWCSSAVLQLWSSHHSSRPESLGQTASRGA